MNSFQAAVLLWTVVAFAERDKLLGEKSEAGFQKCKDALNLYLSEVLPGGGWDNLRNIDMGRVTELTYTHCVTTEDGQYIIPDEVFTIAQKESNLDMNSEILDSWVNYQSTTSVSINMDLNVHHKVNGKFSTEFQRMKTLQVRDHAVTTRVQVRNLVYTVKSNPSSELSLGFKKALLDICDHLEKNQTKMATYLAELLVLNYGTHVITSMDAGAVLVQEDHVKSSFFKDNKGNRTTVTASAGMTFSKVVNINIDMDYNSQNTLTKSYLASRTNSRVQSIGGVPFYPGITFEAWQKGITNHLVAVDRVGLPLHFFVKPDKLPGFPGHLVERLSKTVEAAVKSYYTFNTYPGCTNADSPNFNFQANTDDGSCDGKINNFPFGGVYQECTQHSGDKFPLCPNLEQKNPLTGAFSCPSGYSPVHLLSQIHEEGFKQKECKKKCTLKIFCKTVCEDVFQVAKAEFRAYWCSASDKVTTTSGLLFGGLYSRESVNPMTNQQSCPTSYIPLSLFNGLKVCVSLDHELGYKFSVPFGGFFSCKMGNPLADSAMPKDIGVLSVKKCPGGFSQQLALISDGCQVSYCVKAGIFTKGSLHPVRLPPYTYLPLMSEAAIVASGGMARSWIKDPITYQWRLGEPSEQSSGLSAGSVIGITLGALLALGLIIVLAIYGHQKYKKKEYQGIQGSQGNQGHKGVLAFPPYFTRPGAILDGIQDPSPS
ncbi:macrophage-expressed gene 1 protein-like [Nannospalax galili]|uniref:macrophage-expressed gene 1 protein-like n=1 Tax=Nannospalax galili TaxID=1026970 RepID=UPI0004ED63FE|nr:macrophage-expressed gene 1 protein-like [Nannospalax galili]